MLNLKSGDMGDFKLEPFVSKKEKLKQQEEEEARRIAEEEMRKLAEVNI